MECLDIDTLNKVKKSVRVVSRMKEGGECRYLKKVKRERRKK
jgi:hypothetical protein